MPSVAYVGARADGRASQKLWRDFGLYYVIIARRADSLLTLLLTLCGLSSQKTHRGGLGLGGLVHEEAHPCFPYFIQTPFKRTDAGSKVK